jgi:hypothetical protein
MYITVHVHRELAVRDNREPITFRFDPELLKKLRWQAVNEDRTMTAIVERALRAELGLTPKKYKPRRGPKSPASAIKKGR